MKKLKMFSTLIVLLLGKLLGSVWAYSWLEQAVKRQMRCLLMHMRHSMKKLSGKGVVSHRKMLKLCLLLH